jgi:scyllo-inositol 2-dehydrogenase (NADP+)
VSELPRIRVLAAFDEAGPHRYAALAGGLLRHLSAVPDLEVEVGRRLGGQHVLLVAADDPPDAAQAAELISFLRGGGGVVALHGTLGAWARMPGLSEIVGWAPGEPGPETELLVRPAAGHPFTDRLDPELRVRDELFLSEPPPPDATVLLTAPWHYGEQVVAFSRPFHAGRVVHLGLGHGPATWDSALFARLVFRALRHASGVAPAPTVGVGLLGYGAIGREHASSVRAVPGFELRAVCDRVPERRDEARAAFGVEVHAEAAAMLADPSIDLVVVGVPPVTHAAAALEAVAAGKHVVCEKPFALRVEECDRVLAAAAAGGRLVTVYQSRRWDPDFVALREAVAGGAIGEPFYMESFIGGYSHPCSYWHSHQPISGGTIYDWGSHYFDWMLSLFPQPVAAVAASAHKRVWHDVSNSDQVRVDVTFEGGAEAGFLQSDIAAALKPKWYLLGTAGAVTGDWRQEAVRSRAWTGDLVEEVLAPSESPATVSVHRPDGSREVLGLAPRVAHGFYRNLADHLLLGEPLAVPAGEARRNVAVMEAATRAIAAGHPIEVRE